MIPESSHYWLTNAHVPAALLIDQNGLSSAPTAQNSLADELLSLDLEILEGNIARIIPAGTLPADNKPGVDLRNGMVLPCFSDIHTHLDKGQVWERAPNQDGQFMTAIETIQKDAEQYWTTEDVYRRMKFGLKCSYAHGTTAIRTHLDAGGTLTEVSLEVFKTLRQEWADRITLQAVCLVPLDYFLTPQGETLADQMAEIGGVLGGVAYMNPAIEAQIDRTVALAKDRNLDLDLHVDENNDPASITLRLTAETVLRQKFQRQVVCGHCCSLSTQSPEAIAETIDLIRQASIGIVSLPLCNLYLQGRQPAATPQWRGVTQIHELKRAGVPVAIASDNCRDPFHSFGDHDGLEVFAMSVKIAHLDRPYGDWIRSITSTPADLMGLPNTGRIGVGLAADLVVFKARRYSELLSRSQHDRVVLRRGKAIDTTPPDYSELDDLVLLTD